MIWPQGLFVHRQRLRMVLQRIALEEVVNVGCDSLTDRVLVLFLSSVAQGGGQVLTHAEQENFALEIVLCYAF